MWLCWGFDNKLMEYQTGLKKGWVGGGMDNKLMEYQTGLKKRKQFYGRVNNPPPTKIVWLELCWVFLSFVR